MKKVGVFFVVVLFLCTSCGVKSQLDLAGARANPPGETGSPEVKTVILLDDSPYVGTYQAKRVNGTSFWNDDGTFTIEELKDASFGVRCGTRYLASLTLAAKPGYAWIYKPETGLQPEGYYLEEEK